MLGIKFFLNYNNLRLKIGLRSKFSLYLAILYILSGTSFAIPSLVRSAQTEDINKIPQDYIKKNPH